MASIVRIGERWRAQVRKKGHKPIVKTFDTKTEAQRWGMDIERQLESGKPIERGLKISLLINKYRELRSVQRPISDASTEHYTLKMLEAELGDLAGLTVDAILEFAKRRRAQGAGAYTVNCDLSKLGTVLRYVEPTLLPILAEARPRLAYLGLTGGGGLRERRPTEEEIALILQWLTEQRGQRYTDFVRFAILTAMRRGEIASLRWSDLDRSKKMVLVRDRKDPRQKIGNDQWVPLLAGSYELALQQHGIDPEIIFPIHPQTISKYFKQACDANGIPDLHFHDLRHEGISRMFESGLQIQHVSVVSGHKSWSHLKRYTQIKPESLHSLDTRRDTAPRPARRRTSSPRQRKSES